MLNNITIIGLDPGANHAGIGVIKYNYINNNINYVNGYTIDSTKLYEPSLSDLSVSQGDKFVRSQSIAMAVGRVISYYNPNYVACESPFYHRLHPGAFGPLVEVIYAFRTMLMYYNPHIPFTTFEPLVIKKTMSGKAFADKILMKESLMNNQQLMDALQVDINNLTEHAIDAIAIAWTQLTQLKG